MLLPEYFIFLYIWRRCQCTCVWQEQAPQCQFSRPLHKSSVYYQMVEVWRIQKTRKRLWIYPYSSYHSRHVFCGWLEAEMHRLLKYSSNVNICCKSYYNLRAKGYLARAINATFCKFSWNQQIKLFEPKVTSKAENVFILYNGRVFSSTNVPGIVLLQEHMDLSLQRLQKEADGCNTFPPWAFFILRRAKLLRAVLPRWHRMGIQNRPLLVFEYVPSPG